MSYTTIKLREKLNFKVNNVNKIIKDEEKYFCEFLTTSSKFKLYFEMFIEKSQSNELFKIPLLFSEEYVNVKSYLSYENTSQRAYCKPRKC